jgi:hypothetical protein
MTENGLNAGNGRLVNGSLRKRIGVGLAVVGFILFLFGAEPGFLGLDRSPGTGYLQILIFLLGLALLCIGGYYGLSALWNGFQKTIVADIGLRLVATGYLIAVASGLADLFGFTRLRAPSEVVFGFWQRAGVIIGQGVIALGFLLLIPFRHPRQPEEHNQVSEKAS